MKNLLTILICLLSLTSFSQSKVVKWNNSLTSISKDTFNGTGINSVSCNYGVQGVGNPGNPVRPDFDAMQIYKAISQADKIVGSIGDNPDGAIIKVSDFGRWLYPVTNYTTNGTLPDSLCTWNTFNGTSIQATMPAAPVENQFVVIFNTNATMLTVDPNSKNYNGSNLPRLLRQYEYLTAKYASGAWYGQIKRDNEAYRTYTTSSSSLTMSELYSNYIFSGSSAQTFTLLSPTSKGGLTYFIKNRGSATLTIQSASGSQIYTTAPVANTTIAPGGSIILVCDGGFYNVE